MNSDKWNFYCVYVDAVNQFYLIINSTGIIKIVWTHFVKLKKPGIVSWTEEKEKSINLQFDRRYRELVRERRRKIAVKYGVAEWFEAVHRSRRKLFPSTKIDQKIRLPHEGM